MKSHKNEFGCLMGMVDHSYATNILKVAKLLIPPNILYTDPGDSSYGYDDEPHVTALYGFSPDLTKQELGSILKGIKPFNIQLSALNKFQAEKYDVIKFEIKSPILVNLNKAASRFPNENKFPVYNPHMTLAYVNSNSFISMNENINIQVPITKFKYSYQNGSSLYITL